MKIHPRLKRQEVPYSDPASCNWFVPTAEKPLLATPAAVDMYSHEVILICLRILQCEATAHHGIDYLQVFESESHDQNLWLIEDGPGGAITALLPSDY